MAAGFVDDEGRRRSGSGRVTAFVALSCATAAMGGAIYGYDISIAGGVSSMEPFLRDFFPGVLRRMAGGGGGADGGAPRVSNYCKFDSQLLTLFTSSLYISGLLTAVLLASWVTASRGRRASMILGGFAYIAGAAVSGAAVNVSMAILGRALLGVGLGFTTQSVPLYMAEMAPARYRGAFSNGIQFSLCLGALAATTVNFAVEKIRGGWGWRLSLALAGVPAVFLTVGAVFLPETPNSLVQQGKDRDTVKALLQRIRGVDAVDDELDEIVAANAAAAAAHGENGLWLILSRRRYRPQLAMAVLIPAFTQLTGINAIGFYLPVLLRTVGMGESAALLATVILVVVSSASTLASMFLVDRFGRRALLLAGGAQMLVSEALIGSIMAAKLGDEGAPSKAYATLLVVLIGVYSTGFGWSWGPLSWLVPSEVLPLEVRSAGQSVAVATCFALTVLVAQCFLAALCRMKAWIFFFFAGWIAAMTAFVYFFLPETKGIPIEQVGSVWEEHWFWRRIVGTDEIHASSKLSK
ncbi:hexose carrier protein HEX6-like [Oryza glaberrima]|uniref:Major facilitator superfamily (MFS) profile domain-containing protein n=1 Tax=Oryza glaberrima TaxID=4538 RepID=I1R1D2_ORYGL|nr:hexose carrier protein HEX6-like [Oryza glaberrima]